jgi:hypothetical protein
VRSSPPPRGGSALGQGSGPHLVVLPADAGVL